MRTGRRNDCSMMSSRPRKRAPPPARINPAGIWPSRPARWRSSRISESNSMARGSMMSVSMCGKIVRGGRSPTLAISIAPLSLINDEAAQPWCRLMRSASGMGVRKPTARSLVKWSPPMASTARRTSSRSMSRGRCPRVIPPRLFTPRTWFPATPMSASSTGTLATPSASSTARRIELTVESRFTISPLRRPLDSAAPSARNFTDSPSISAMRMEVFVLPMSSPTRYLSFFANPPLLDRELFCSRGHRTHAGVRVHNHLPRVLQIDRLHMPGMGLPLRKIVDEHFEFAGKIACAEMHGHGLRIGWAGQSAHDHAQIFGNRQVDFADILRRAAARQLDGLHEFLIELHALFALLARQVFRNAGDNRKLEVGILRTIENHAMGIDERHFIAIARKRDGSAFGELDANAIGENALHGRGLDPGNLLELAPAGIERNRQEAAIAVLHKLL